MKPECLKGVSLYAFCAAEIDFISQYKQLQGHSKRAARACELEK